MSLRYVAIACVVAACGDESTTEPILIGLVTPETGDLAVAGRNQQDSVLLAIKEINDAGGVLGRQLAMEKSNDATTAAGASTAYTQLLGRGVSAILGPIHSAGAGAIADQIRTGRTLTISGGATSPGLATLDDGGFFFRTVPSDAVQAIVLADQIEKAGHQNVCIVHRNDPYGVGLEQALRARLPAAVTVTPAPYDPAGALTEVMEPCEPVRTAAMPARVFVTFEGDGTLILGDAASHGWNARDQGIYLVDGNRRPELFSALANPGAFEGAFGTAPSGPDPDSSAGARLGAFQERFMVRYHRPAATNGENHYDSLYLAALAIEIAGTADDGDAIRAAISRTAAGAKIAAGDWAGLRGAIATQQQVDLEGASGEVDLDPDSGELLPPYYVRLWTVDRGVIVDEEVVTVSAP